MNGYRRGKTASHTVKGEKIPGGRPSGKKGRSEKPRNLLQEHQGARILKKKQHHNRSDPATKNLRNQAASTEENGTKERD